MNDAPVTAYFQVIQNDDAQIQTGNVDAVSRN
jgi:hypothetical protein